MDFSIHINFISNTNYWKIKSSLLPSDGKNGLLT